MVLFYFPIYMLYGYSMDTGISMSKAGSKMRTMKKVVQKVNHGNLIRTNIPAGMAVAGPPLGPMLGQVIFTIYFLIYFSDLYIP